MDAYILMVMYKYFVFVSKSRLDMYKSLGMPQPFQSKVINAWIPIVIVLAATDIIAFHVMSIFDLGPRSETTDKIIFYLKYINYPMYQFVSAATITYIFYYKAKMDKNVAEVIQRDIIGNLKQ
jgi:hypothetical protein